jgi:hypothetical protein
MGRNSKDAENVFVGMYRDSSRPTPRHGKVKAAKHEKTPGYFIM